MLAPSSCRTNTFKATVCSPTSHLIDLLFNMVERKHFRMNYSVIGERSASIRKSQILILPNTFSPLCFFFSEKGKN
uniref:Uncharacterized protein n=1 Tax=Populus trichocarpa TaxID=3694 RepID=A0A2K1X1W5_POPTR